MKVIIIGGGVMGMMLARELVQHHVEVVLMDKGVCGAEASWAGGGIISPLYPWRYPDAVTALASWSQAYYPNLIQTLEAESDIDPELTRHGLLMLNVDDRDEALVWSKSSRNWLDPLSAGQIYELEPALREGFTEGLWMRQVSSVRNPRLLKALRAILDHETKVTFKELSAVTEIKQPEASHVTVVTETGERLSADYAVCCAGAWSRHLLGDLIDVAPVKGQMIRFEARPALVNRVVLNHGKYVIPRRDGSIIAGSTLEHTGYDKHITESAKAELADAAIDMFPGLAKAAISHHWSGLRPGVSDGIPYIGPLPDKNRVLVNAGHYRNGLVLAPASVRLVTAMLCGESPPLDPNPYLPALR